MTRRSFLLQSLVGSAGLGLFHLPVATGENATEGFKAAELNAMTATANAFMRKHSVPGLSVAIAKEERLVYASGFGLADKDGSEAVTPRHLFRIASVTKPVTSATIFRLVEMGKLNLTDRVFGPGGILGIDYGNPPYSPHVDEITVEHLLTHTSGGWQNDDRDPMFSHTEMNHGQLITWTLANRPLEFTPGAHYAYSNFGYCVLGRVIEKLTGQTYAAAVQGLALQPCGISTMRISGNALAERAPNEVVYYDQDGSSPYDMNVRRMDSHGGWLATATDLTRFLVRVDGFAVKPDILRPETIRAMTTASKADAGYAKGWCVNKYHNWWHMGSLPGTTTVMVRTSGRFCWAALTNTRKNNSTLNDDLDHLMWDMVAQIHTWPSCDLFD
ncbi:MAG: serine hydrolase domain-containing protein [Limisphaerales bacterium]